MNQMLSKNSIFVGFWAIALLVTVMASQFLTKGPTPSKTNAQVMNNKDVDTFVTHSGSKLLLNGKEFRIAGVNIYWLGLDDTAGGVNYPSEFRVNDALSTAREMGANVVRAQTLGTSVGCAKCIEPSLNVFNTSTDPFASIDYAVKTARDNGLRLIIPLTSQWNMYYGGKHTFTSWRGVSDDAFHNDPQVIEDFKTYIDHILNHINRYTGKALKDDPTILAWETGNELFTIDATKWSDAWTEDIAKHIKTIAPEQLVSDGRVGNSQGTHLLDASLSVPDVDMMSDHLYPPNITDMLYDAGKVTSHNKVFYVGEYDWTGAHGGDSLPAFFAAVENNNVSGDIVWSLLPQSENGGYVAHADGYTLHFPGDNDHMKGVISALSAHFEALTNRLDSSPTNPASPSAVISLVKSGACRVDYTIYSQWNTGFNTNIKIHNNTGKDVKGWMVTWNFPGDQQISGMWYASFTQTGKQISVHNPDYNATIANGKTVEFGFNGAYSGINAIPTTIYVNNIPCSVNK